MKLIALIAAAVTLSACSSQIQTTSGADYNAPRAGFDPRSGTPTDRAVVRAAAIEPILRFPARIGLARIERGQLSPIPPQESDAWIAFAQAHADFGTFVPINPLLAELASSSYGSYATSHIVEEVRLGAAQQHVDAVLIYTVAKQSKDRATPLAVADLSIIGGFLIPSRIVEGQAIASALLVDVHNGYPYGTAQVSATEADFVPTFSSNSEGVRVADAAEVKAVQKLTLEIGTMTTRLRTELMEKELTTLRAKVAAQPDHAIKRRRSPSQT